MVNKGKAALGLLFIIGQLDNGKINQLANGFLSIEII